MQLEKDTIRDIALQINMSAADIFEWGDERAEGDDSRVGEELSDLGHPPDVLRPVLLRETEVLV